MKKYLILFAVLAFGLCACEADGGSGSSSGRLEGSWKVYKAELLFNGKVVEQADPSDPDFDMGLEYSFSDGYMTVRDSEETLHYPYTYSGKTITATAYFIPIQITVRKLTGSEMEWDMPVPSLNPERDGKVVAKYDGQTIYGSDDYFIETFWYKSGGKIVICSPIDDDDYSEGWFDTMRVYLRKK